MAEWKPEFEVSEVLVRTLLARQFPQLIVGDIRQLGVGWDNIVYLVNGEWAFRFPQRQVAVAGVHTESVVLPRLAPHLPLPIPCPVFLGNPSADYPWPFFGARMLPGRESAELHLSDEERTVLARPLARFLKALHAPELRDALRPDLPLDTFRRTDMAVRLPKARHYLGELRRLGLWDEEAALAGMFAEAERLPPPEAIALVHGDLHFRHLLLDEARRFSGVIDWGDLCLGDTAMDLHLYWSFLPPGGRQAFLEEYGPVPEDRLLRARVIAIFLAAALASYGHQEGLHAIEREALWSLRQAMP